MEKCEITFCKICFDIITDGSFRALDANVRKVLDVILLKLSAEENEEPVICKACAGKLFAAFDFKVTCTNTEDSIFSYVDPENITSVDLRKVYLKLRGKEHESSILEAERICRLCMQSITCEFTSVGKIETSTINKYIPEVNFNLTRDPVICSVCLDSLNTHSSFLKNCLHQNEKVDNIDVGCNTESSTYIKSENIEVKMEEYDGSTKDPLNIDLNMHSSFLKNSLDVDGKIKNCNDDYPTDSPFYIKSEEIELKTEEYNEYDDTTLHDDKIVDTDKTQHKNSSNSQSYQCNTCDFKTKFKSNLSQHQLKHKDFAEVPHYMCLACNYKTTRKSSLTRHQLRHKDFSEVQVYKCDACDFKTKYKNSLTTHQVIHKDFLEAQVYKHENDLITHQLVHKEFPEGKIYKCDKCDYKTKHKSYLIKHQLKHKDFSEVEMYKCDTCDYKTKRKDSLICHQLKHKDFSEVQVYKCDVCDYKTKHKDYLIKHQLKHKDFSEVRVYNCDICDFKAKRKFNLITHQLKHKNFSEVEIYKCNACDFKTKYKGSITDHQLVHKDISEVQLYKCDRCDFKTKYKSRLISHELKHKDFSEVQVYKCDECNYRTKHKRYLISHQLKHNDKTLHFFKRKENNCLELV